MVAILTLGTWMVFSGAGSSQVLVCSNGLYLIQVPYQLSHKPFTGCGVNWQELPHWIRTHYDV